MGKILHIKEFDIITDNPDFKDDKGLNYLEKEPFGELDSFVRKNLADDETEESDVQDFFKAFSKKGVGDVIQARNYVGLIQMESGFQVQILPKIDMVDDSDSNRSTTKVFIEMLSFMKDFPGKLFYNAGLRTDNLNLYEIFIKMYIRQVVELAKRGLRSSYIAVEDNENYYKGKLLISEHIKKNIAHKERFFVAYDEFKVNRPENRIIKSTLIKLLHISDSSENKKEIRKLLTYFELVEPSVNYDKDFSLVVIDRTTRDYEDIIAWSKVFLKNKSFTTFSGDINARALLFPMEKVYESYVARNMIIEYSELGWDVSSQDQGFYLFKEESRDVFSLRPDIVIRTKTNHTYVMDTKWKRLYNSPNNNYGISQADMYQMFAYSKKYNTPYIWLLYPVTEEMVNHKPIVFKSNTDTEVRVFFVNVAQIQDTLEELKKQIMLIEKSLITVNE